MALKYASAFGLNSMTNGVEFDTITGSPTVDTTTVPYTGGRAMRCNPSAATAFIRLQFKPTGTDLSWIQFKLRITTAPAALTRICILHDTGWPIDRAGLRLNSNRTLELWDEDAGAQRGSDSSALNVDQWYNIMLVHDDATEEISGYIDGVRFATGLVGGNAQNGNRFDLGVIDSATCDLRFADILCGDGTGTKFNNFILGDYRLKYLRPNASGDNNPTTGSFADIDEETPNDATDFIHLDTNGNIGDFNIEDSGLTTEIIKAVLVGARHRAETAAAMSFQLRIKSQASGTVETSATTTHDDTTWRTNGDTNVFGYQLVSLDDPQTGNEWTPPMLDSTQIGVEAIDADPDIHVTALWAIVIYYPTADKLSRIATSESVASETTNYSSSIPKVRHSVYKPSGDSYIIFFTIDGSPSNVGTRTKVDLFVDGVMVATFSPRVKSVNDYNSFFFFHRVTGKTNDFECEIRVSSTDNQNNAVVKNARIVSWRYSDWQGLDLQYAEGNAAATALAATYADGASVTFTPSSAGDYFVLGCLGIQPGSTTISAIARLVVDATDLPFNSGTDEHFSREAPAVVANAYYSFATGIRQNLAASSKTIKTQTRNESGTTGNVQYSRVLAFRADAFVEANYTDLDTAAVDSNATTTAEDRASLTTTAPGAAQDYLVIAGITHGVLVTGTQAERTEGLVLVDSVEVDESEFQWQEASAPQDFMNACVALHKNTSSAFTVKTQHRMSARTDDTSEAKNSFIIIIRGDLPSIVSNQNVLPEPIFIQNRFIPY